MRPVIEEAVRILRRGGLVAFPTETVYGLGADARNPEAVARVFAAKGRPADHPLIVHLGDRRQVEAWAQQVDPRAERLMEAFWPGPLTLILPMRDGIDRSVTGGQATVGLRVPDHPIAAELLRAFGGGVAAPSANRFGSVSPTTAAHVALELGEAVDLILDGGACRVGVESTIVDLSHGEARVLRPGGVPREALEAVLGAPVPWEREASTRASGTLPSHYAPRARVHVAGPQGAGDLARRLEGRVVVLAPKAVEGFDHLELPHDADAAARALYAALREVDARGYAHAVLTLPSAGGLGEAVSDRIRRAAAPRDD